MDHINDIQELADYLGASRPDEAAIRKRLFKDTECGISFGLTETGFYVAGYAEGSDGQPPAHDLAWGCSVDDLMGTIDQADTEGCALWEEANAEEEPGDHPSLTDAERNPGINEGWL